MDKHDEANLKKRYLIWFYKFTKEALDRIDRKFTQLEIDREILAELKKLDTGKKISKHIQEFQEYIQKKENEGKAAKFEANQEKSEYAYLVLKLKAIEKTILKEFGAKTLAEIKTMFEREFTERILKSTEH